MTGCSRFCLVGLALGIIASPAEPATPKPVPVCTVSAEAPRFIGKRVRVEGYVFDLSSHGFVLASKRTCKGQGQLVLQLSKVSSTPIWRAAFANSTGPKRAVLVGVVRWKKARFEGLIPGLDVEKVESVAPREADESDF